MFDEFDEPRKMTYAEACDLAANVASRFKMPAFIHRHGDIYQVSCSPWGEMTPDEMYDTKAIATPDGRIYKR